MQLSAALLGNVQTSPSSLFISKSAGEIGLLFAAPVFDTSKCLL